MTQLRTSRAQDVPRLRELWKLAFGDEDAYIDHFFQRYYAPERMLVLEENDVVQAMTAWFDMPLVSAQGTTYPSAYLYAVTTHPDCRGRGVAGQLLSFADRWLKEQGFVCMSTVPARTDLHAFFAQNGFEECFALEQQEYTAIPTQQEVILEQVSVAEYGRLREQMLTGMDHVAYSQSALEYQQGVCALSGGGMYRAGEQGCACVEVSGAAVFVKELLVPERDRNAALGAIAKRYPAQKYWVRGPYAGQSGRWEFAMMKWLIPKPEWSGRDNTYLGLAFD